MILNYRLNTNSKKLFSLPIIFIHGLFGNLSNFNSLSQAFNKKFYDTLQIDLRNHGSSPHHDLMTYMVMAQDICNVLDRLSIFQCVVIGHSMGGKVAMTLPLLGVKRVIRMIIIDIAPITYTVQKHCNIFTAINHVITSRIVTRTEARKSMKKFISNENIISFLLKSFKQGIWDFNIQNIQKNYSELNKWEYYTPWSGDVLFICGNHSSYVKECYYNNIYQQFPRAFIHKIDGAGHWVHAEKYNEVLNVINDFLSY